MLGIQSYCKISNNQLVINGEILFECDKNILATDFLTQCYHQTATNYLKFFKMDNLAKIGFLAANLLLRTSEFDTPEAKNDFGIILANSVSSLDIDTTYEQTIASPDNYFPSPSNFVYTLPNIVIGEICIKYKITGENTFFIAQNIAKANFEEKVRLAFEQTKTNTILCGWVEFLHNDYQAFCMLIKRNGTQHVAPFTNEFIEQLMLNN